MEKVTMYKAKTGELFEDEQQCLAYEIKCEIADQLNENIYQLDEESSFDVVNLILDNKEVYEALFSLRKIIYSGLK